MMRIGLWTKIKIIRDCNSRIIDKLDDSHPDYKSLEQLQQEDPDNIVVFHSEDSEEFMEEQEVEEESGNSEEGMLKITPDIFYNPGTKYCYMGFTNYQRAKHYGCLLKEVHEFTSKYTVGQPKVVTHHKHELSFLCSEDNARRLAPLNLKKEIDSSVNKKITDTWKRIKVNQEYPKIDIAELELADVVTKSPHGKSFYEVIQNCGEYVITRCIKHHSIPVCVVK